MRRILGIVLLLAVSLPLIAPLFALGETAESNLPACCRRHGAHHCMMSPEQIAALENGQHLTTLHSPCPLFPRAIAPAHHPTVTLQPAAALYAAWLAHPAFVPQVEAWARVALEGARHKRGPPALRLSSLSLT